VPSTGRSGATPWNTQVPTSVATSPERATSIRIGVRSSLRLSRVNSWVAHMAATASRPRTIGRNVGA
jgi:hypothetical protein